MPRLPGVVAVLVAAAAVADAAKRPKWPRYDEPLVLAAEPRLLAKGGAARHHWMPEVHAFADNTLLVRVKVDDDAECGCGPAHRDVARLADPCFKPCSHPGFVDYTTLDGGETFTPLPAPPANTKEYFCGAASVADGTRRRMCPIATDASADESPLTPYEAAYWTIDNMGNVVEDGARKPLKFEPPPALPDAAITAFGPSLVHASKTYWLVALDNYAHLALYRSNTTTSKVDWSFVSVVPVNTTSLARASLSMVKGDTLLVAVETAAGAYVQVVSRTTGRHWSGDVVRLPESRKMPLVVSTYYSTAIAGTGYFGGIIHQKSVPNPKAFDKALTLTMTRNHTDEPWTEPTLRRTPELYTSDYVRGEVNTIKACDQEPYESFCESTGVVGLAPVNATYGEYTNSTTFLVCYDRLADGWTGPTVGRGGKHAGDNSERSDEVWCRRVRMSDEATVARKLEKQSDAKERKEKRDRDEQERKEREKKRKEDKEALLTNLQERWEAYNAQFLAEAEPWTQYDGELVVIKDALPEEFAGHGFEDEI